MDFSALVGYDEPVIGWLLSLRDWLVIVDKVPIHLGSARIASQRSKKKEGPNNEQATTRTTDSAYGADSLSQVFPMIPQPGGSEYYEPRSTSSSQHQILNQIAAAGIGRNLQRRGHHDHLHITLDLRGGPKASSKQSWSRVRVLVTSVSSGTTRPTTTRSGTAHSAASVTLRLISEESPPWDVGELTPPHPWAVGRLPFLDPMGVQRSDLHFPACRS